MDGPNETDRADFAKRLSHYGLDPDAVPSNSLSTITSSVTRLYAGGGDSAVRPVILRTNNFDDVNKWIGVPDRVFETIEPFAEAPHPSKLKALRPAVAPAAEGAATRLYERRADVSVTEKAAAPRATAAVSRADESALARDVARAYLYGDSRKLQGQSAWLSSKFAAVDVALWAFLNIVVKSGSVLEFGPGPNVLVACNVTIEAGGKIRARGHLKIDATVLQRTLPIRVALLNPALELLGQLGVNRG